MSMMQFIMFQTRTGGVSAGLQRFAVVKTNLFTKRHWRQEITNLTPEKRQIVAFVLSQNFAFTQLQLARLFKVDIRTVRRDYEVFDLFSKRNKKFIENTEKLIKYIKYYQNRINL